MTDAIPCQACAGEPDDEAYECSTCCGSRAVLRRCLCQGCKRTYWVRPGVHTCYEGKRWHTFDGVEMVVRGWGSQCAECDAKGER